MNILLGSKSPRRSELLRKLDVSFDLVDIRCDEQFPADMIPDHVARFLSLKKSNTYGILEKGDVLITADTTVIVDQKVLNKPKSESEAREMLLQISGKSHQVITGVTIRSVTKTHTFSESTSVTVDTINPSYIDYYIQQHQPFDKAGSYGIQDWLGLSHISKIEGCYYNVMGLPTNLLFKRLKNEFGYAS